MQLKSYPILGSTAFIARTSHWPQLEADLSQGIHPADLWQVQGDDELLSIAQVRGLKQWVVRSPLQERKVVILKQADHFPGEVANALLKVLEEPPPFVLLALLSETDHFLPTIRSRVPRLYLEPDSATIIKRPQTDLEVWQAGLAQYDLQKKEERQAATQALYLHSLLHAGLKSEPIIHALHLDDTI